jgi:hypothetical protein
MKKPETVPSRLSPRLSGATPSPPTKDRADETKAKTPNTPSIQAPIDIGSQSLKFMIMLRKRLGVPRSRIRRMPQRPISKRAST